MSARCNKCGNAATAGDGYCLFHAAIDTADLPPRPERRATAPAAIIQSPAWPIAYPYSDQGALWEHQTNALNLLLQGNNIVAATATASGKSLIFQTWALHCASLNPKSKTLVFYPTKALANDQMRRWRQACATIGMPRESVKVISGDVPMNSRSHIIEQARIIIMTPDVCHAWMLRQASSPAVKESLRHLGNIIIDEAHVYENVFGSNAAYMFRRLNAAADAAGNPGTPRLIAATATIQEPAAHLKKLTGQNFAVVGEDQNGSPRHARQIAHIALTTNRQRGGSPEEQLARLLLNILENDPQAQVIAFHDSRQGIERVAQAVARDDVLPYRSGYQAEDRKRIEDQLQRNRIRGVISTSALELGIDMPDLNYGVNMGLPQTRKQLQQRIGRVGRSRPGTFVILCPETQFIQHGDNLADYIHQSVEPSHLYTANEYVAYQQALCLKQELAEADQDSLAPPAICDWPEKFDAALKNAHGRPPPHLSLLTGRSLGHAPQLAYGLRNSGEERLKIYSGDPRSDDAKVIEEITIENALREAYPGARYHHQRRPYEICSWKRERQTGAPYVIARKSHALGQPSRPLSRRTITADISNENLIAHRYRTKPQGSISSLHLTVTNSVEGFYDTDGALREYRTTQKINPNLSRKEKDLPTQGVLIQIRQNWFQGEAGEPWQARTQTAQALMNHLAYRCSIARGDLGAAVDNIFIKTPQGCYLSDCAAIVYDNVYGGLDLSGQLWSNIEQYARQIRDGAQAAKSAAGLRIDRDNAYRLARWLEQPDGPLDEAASPNDADRTWRILRPGSQVAVYNPATERMEQATIKATQWREGVKYQLTTQAGHTMEANEDRLETIGGRDWVLWEPRTGAMHELTGG